MATANNECSLVKSFEQCNISSENQYKNLNLKQNQKCSTLTPIQISSKQNNDKFYATNSEVSDKFDKKEKQHSWKNKCIKISNFSTQNQTERETAKKDWKKNGFLNSTKNSSTLSLHIKVYENSIKAGKFNDGMEKETFGRDLKQSFFGDLKFQNTFEFPRQQEGDRNGDPELSQFKASQRLYDPNQGSSSSSSNSQQKMKVEYSKYDPPSEFEVKMQSALKTLEEIISKNSEIQSQTTIINMASKNDQQLDMVMSGLIYGCLTSKNRENFTKFSKLLQQTASFNPTITLTPINYMIMKNFGQLQM